MSGTREGALEILVTRLFYARDLVSLVNDPIIGNLKPLTAHSMGHALGAVEGAIAMVNRDLDDHRRAREEGMSVRSLREPRENRGKEASDGDER